MEVDVLDGEIVESLQALIREDCGGEGVEFCEKVLSVGSIVGLEYFCHEERALGLDGSEDSGFFLAHRIQILNKFIIEIYSNSLPNDI